MKDCFDALEALFGDYRHFEPRDITFEFCADCDMQVRWDQVYGGTEWCWEKFVHGPGLNGFAVQNTVVLNVRHYTTGTIIHELLHVHASQNFARRAGLALCEGTTDFLKQLCLYTMKLTAVNSYQKEMIMPQTWLQGGLHVKTLTAAYFWGYLRFDELEYWVDSHCVGTFREQQFAANKKDWTLLSSLVEVVC